MIFLVILLAALAATGIIEARQNSRSAEIWALVKEARQNEYNRQQRNEWRIRRWVRS
jgi:hypothetical protein